MKNTSNFKLVLLFICCAAVIYSCRQKPESKTIIEYETNNLSKEQQLLSDSLIKEYIQGNIQWREENAKKPFDIQFDHKVESDTANYLMFKIGNVINDKEGSRITTIGWVMINPVSKKLYEYDLNNDTINLWEASKNSDEK